MNNSRTLSYKACYFQPFRYNLQWYTYVPIHLFRSIKTIFQCSLPVVQKLIQKGIFCVDYLFFLINYGYTIVRCEVEAIFRFRLSLYDSILQLFSIIFAILNDSQRIAVKRFPNIRLVPQIKALIVLCFNLNGTGARIF